MYSNMFKAVVAFFLIWAVTFELAVSIHVYNSTLSETLRQSENAVEKSPIPAGSIFGKGGDIHEDNETEISEYLTLAQLGSILRELAVKGKI